MEFIQHLPITVQTAKIIKKVLYRAYSALEWDHKKLCPSCKEALPRDNQLTPKELTLAKSVSIALSKAISDYKTAMQAELLKLGEHGYLEGDGILRILGVSAKCPLGGYSDPSPDEFRVFVRTDFGTEYAGTYSTEQEARAVWLKQRDASIQDGTITRPPHEVRIYEWIKDIKENRWHCAEVANLAEGQDNLDQLAEDQDNYPKFDEEAISRLFGDPEGFGGSDYDTWLQI